MEGFQRFLLHIEFKSYSLSNFKTSSELHNKIQGVFFTGPAQKSMELGPPNSEK